MSDDETCLHCALWRAAAAHDGEPSELLAALANVVADILAALPVDQMQSVWTSHNLKVAGFLMARRSAERAGVTLQ